MNEATIEPIIKTATFVKHRYDDGLCSDMIFSLSEPRPIKVVDGEVISTNHILVMNTYYFGAYILTLALPCAEDGEVDSYLSDQVDNLMGEHDPEKLLNKLGYTVDWGKSAPQSKGA